MTDIHGRVDYSLMNEPAPYAKIGNLLQRARLAKGWTLAEFSEATGGVYSTTRINNYERGIRQIKPRAARDLSSTLGNIRAEELLGLDSLALSENEIDLIRQFRAADERGKATILAVIKAQAA